MILALYIIGFLVILFSFIAGITSGSSLAFFTIIVGGSALAIILFALARIIDNQNKILHRNKICQICLKEYDSIYNSCPYCGNKG